jgi:hypothetical protein
MPFYGEWRRVDLVRTDISEERIASIFSVEKNTQATRRHIPEEILRATGCKTL